MASRPTAPGADIGSTIHARLRLLPGLASRPTAAGVGSTIHVRLRLLPGLASRPTVPSADIGSTIHVILPVFAKALSLPQLGDRLFVGLLRAKSVVEAVDPLRDVGLVLARHLPRALDEDRRGIRARQVRMTHEREVVVVADQRQDHAVVGVLVELGSALVRRDELVGGLRGEAGRRSDTEPGRGAGALSIRPRCLAGLPAEGDVPDACLLERVEELRHAHCRHLRVLLVVDRGVVAVYDEYVVHPQDGAQQEQGSGAAVVAMLAVGG